jgi:hypothetical protein
LGEGIHLSVKVNVAVPVGSGGTGVRPFVPQPTMPSATTITKTDERIFTQ